MAALYIKYLSILLVTCVLITCVLDGVEGRRGGGGRGGGRGGSRGSRGRGSSRGTGSRGSGRSFGGSTRSYKNVVLRGRIVKGSSHYTASTWRSAALAGAIFGGAMYLRRHPHGRKMPPICTNKFARAPNGRIYGHFICPRMNETASSVYCCGPKYREYCCKLDEAKKYYSLHHSESGSSLSLGAIFGILVAAAVFIVMVIFCCKKKREAGHVISTGASKRDNTFSDSSPHVPPPSYDIAMHDAGYDEVSGQGLPYQPQPQPPVDAKYGLPQPQVGPFPGEPPAPYPPPVMGPDAPYPYPPPASAPYPPPAGAPYPPPAGAPYPPSGGDSYPPPTGGPYQPPTGDTYPPPTGDSYPPPTGGPYPPSNPGESPYPVPGTAPPYPAGPTPYVPYPPGSHV